MNLTKDQIYEKVANQQITTEAALDMMAKLNDRSQLVMTGTSPATMQSGKETAVKPFGTDFSQLKHRLEQYLTGVVERLLQLPAFELDREENFMDLGVDSTQLIQLTQQFEKSFGIELYPTLFFEYQNITELAEYLSQEYTAVLAQHFNLHKNDTSQTAEMSTVVKTPMIETVGFQSVSETSKPTDGKLLMGETESKQEETNQNCIAVIGMAGVFADSPNLEAFWKNLRDKKNLIQEIPADHFDYQPWFDPDSNASDKMYCKWGSFIDDVAGFDAGFFNISPREAELMDPQLRLLLQVLYTTAEDAGYPSRIRGTKTGMYVGVCFHDYADEMARQGKPVAPHDGTGNAATMMANRPSFYLNLTGPSLAVDTACSSSLVALHLACKALQNNECEMAFAAGTNLLLSSWHYRYFCSIGALSHTGRCHTFDQRADGYVPGEGVGAVLLKPLANAIADGDQIHAIIRGSAINHGGYTPSITAPSANLEAQVILDAWNDAKINPQTIGYIEAHGTGTKLGDPVEINGLKKAFKKHTESANKLCAVGSAKAHIGHTEGAAGIAGVIKVILSLKNKEIPAMPMLNELNPYIQLDDTPLYINRDIEKWEPINSTPRRAGVSSFGFGGAYGHVVLEEYENRTEATRSPNQLPQLIVLSAKNAERLQVHAQNMADFFAKPAPITEQVVEKEEHDLLSEIQPDLLKLASDVLKVNENEIGLDETFSEMGFDTVSLIELSHRLNDKYFVSITPTLLSEYPSLAAVTQYLCDQSQAGNSTALKNHQTNLSLAELAYTLLVGREAMAERLAMVVSSVDDLTDKLTQYIQGQTEIDDFYRGNVKTNKAQSNLLIKGKAGKAFLKVAIEEQELSQLAQLWASGVDIDWQLLYPNQKPQRIYLPTYPFARERYWIPASDPKAVGKHGQIAKLHPLLESNTSTLNEQRFTTSLTGSEFYLTDHVVAEQKTLPGVAYLEMARAAGELANTQTVMRLTNIVWAKPIIVSDTPIAVHVSLYPVGQQVEFEVSTLDNNQSRQVHAQGKLIYGAARNSETVDIEAIQNRCVETWSRSECYQLFKTTGINYGPGFQPIQALYHNDREALSRLQLPNELKDGFNDFVWHPSLMDGALQTVIGLIGVESTLYLPYALGEIEVFNPLTTNCYAYVNGAGGNGGVKKFNIQLLDETGQMLVRLTDFSVRSLKPHTDTPLWQSGDMQVEEQTEKKSILDSATEPSQLLEKLQKDILAMAGAILKVSAKDIDPNDDISEYGFDSISFTKLGNQINDKYQLEITPARFFEYPSVSAFSQFLYSEYFERLFDEDSDNLKIVSTTSPNLADEAEVKLKSRFIEPVTVRELPRLSANTPIAIIGMSGVMPQSADLESFWQHLEAGDDLITEVPPDRWDWQTYSGDISVETTKWGGFLPAVDKFDPLFFGISPREAELMDPQQRLFLETVWKTIEDAGYKASDLSGTKTGLFVGVGTHDYNELLKKNMLDIEAHSSTGIAHSILANRISYLLNLHGPSEPIDTACSSSLVAIHRAVEAIRSGTCEMAIAGGVNVMLTPTLTLSFSKAGMLSEDGRCKTFDKRANGYVRGEGVGAIWLKPLEQAQADGDMIYAVIKGTAENHGGHATSLTAPNPNAQTQLLISAFDDAQIDPSTISYIEAHGTGTPLGDPIEINGLKNAFAELYQKSGKSLPEKPYCGLGSVKTNIGHLETAAGIAGVLKVLLAMKHKTLPGLLHFSKLNSYIQLQDSPFYIVTEKKTWTPLTDSFGQQLPRRAGVSSFGFGGANAHLVLEEYESKLPPIASASNQQLLVLSAKNDERLKAYARQMVDFLEKNPDMIGSELAYTLQVGREAMAERLATVVSSVDDFKEKLTQYVQGQTEIEDFYRGHVKTNKAQSDLLVEGREGEEFVKIIIHDQKFNKLAKLWVSGVDIDWPLLYPNQKPQRISLPTYPFARERYWIPTASSQRVSSQVAKLHPLLESNTSTFRCQKFTTKLTGDEFYLTDHVVGSQKTLPGVAYLEMARAAGELAGEQPVTRITNIVWAKPIQVSDTSIAVHISLYPVGQQVEFEVSTMIDEQKQVYAQGQLIDESTNTKNAETMDISAIQTRCVETWDGAKCYQLFKTTGLNYGPGFQTIQALYRNDREVLSCLQLPNGLKDGFNDFVWHPSLMDGALQTVIGLMGQTTTPYLPFALGEVELLGPLSKTCYAYVISASRSPAAESSVKKFNISILDETGQEQVRLKDFSVRALKPHTDTSVTMYFQSVWESSRLEEQTGHLTPTGTVLLFDTDDNRRSSFKERLKSEVILVMPGESYQALGTDTYSINPQNDADYRQLLEVLNQQNEGLPSHIIHLWSQVPFVNDEAALNAQIDMGFYSIFLLSQALMAQKPQKPIQLLYIYLETEETQPQYAALSGFAKTIGLENSKLVYKTVAVPALSKEVLDVVLAEFQANDGVEVRYSDNQRWVKHLQEFDLARLTKTTTPLRENGVYLITGGAGGLGLIFAEYLAKQVQAKLVLTGRSALNEEQIAKIQSLNALGAEVIYLQADVSKRDEVATLIAQTKSHFNEINGIIHSAGVIKDALVVKKTPTDMAAVLAPKVYGTVWLDEVTQNEPLDFLVLFSSVAAVMGNVGQCDYAYANGFMDNFAFWREGQRVSRKRSGKTLSINWPLWQRGGMRVDEQTEKWLANTIGIQTLSTETGLEAFSQGLAWTEINQFMVLSGSRPKIRKGLGLEAVMPSATIASTAPAEKGQLLEQVQKDILAMAGAILKVSAKDIEPTDDISEYGFDSIILMEFTNQINDKYRLEITPTLLIEYPSITAFSEFLCGEYQQRFLEYYQDRFNAVSSTLSPTEMETTDIEQIKSRFIESATNRSMPQSSVNTATEINRYLPVSIEQQRMWIVEQFKPTGTAPNLITLGFQLTGQLNITVLEQSLNDIVRRNEVLRTTFAMVEGHPVQNLRPHLSLTLPVEDFQQLDKSKQSSLIEQRVAEAGLPFDLTQGPLWRVKLMQLGKSDYLLLFVIHHIIFDALSITLFFRELAALYEAFCLEKPSPLSEISFQYGDFAVWQQQWLQSQSLEKPLNFWKKQLEGAPPLLELPTDRPRPLLRSFQSAHKPFQLPGDLAIRQFSEAQNVTLFTILMAGLNTLLYQYTGLEDIMVGFPTSGRIRPEVNSLIGFFAYPIVLRTDLSGNPSFRELLGRVHKGLVEASAHKQVPFGTVVEAIAPERSSQYNPLIQVLFSFVENDLDGIELPGVTFKPIVDDMGIQTSMDLFFFISEVDNVLSGVLNYQTDIFDSNTIESLVNSYRQIIEQAVQSPETRISEFKLSNRVNVKSSQLEKPPNRLAISATFTAEPVADSVDFWLQELELGYQIEFAPYNQVFQQLLNPDSLLAQNSVGINLVLVRFEDWVRTDLGVAKFCQQIERNVQELIPALTEAAARTSCPHVVCLCPSAPETLADQERAAFLQHQEALMVAELAEVSGVYVVTTAALNTTYPVAKFYHPHGDQFGHVPFTPLFFTALGTMLARQIYAILQTPYKVIVLDCDQTLWQGVCGEDGVEGIVMNPAHQALQEFMVAQHDNGMLLCLCSKNHEDDVIQVFERHSEMPLQLQHLVGWRINWKAKSENIQSLSQELQLGLDSFIFIDDNPVECAEVQANCPDVLTLQLPENTNNIPRFLQHLWAFDRLKVTDEDRQRTGFYQQNSQREQFRQKSLTLGDFLNSLELEVQITEMVSSQIGRAAQLTQRTNQFNATTIRRTEPEIQNIFKAEEYSCLVVEVKDRFGDYGLVGVIIFTIAADTLKVETFLLSCRVLGRGVEHQMLAKLGDIAQKRGLSWVDVIYQPTAKNQPVLSFLVSVGSEFQESTEKHPHFKFPVTFCKNITYSHLKTANEKSESSIQSFAPTQAGIQANAELLTRIATQLYDPEQILPVLESKTDDLQQQRQQPLVPPRTETESQLVELWRKTLHLEKIGIDDNFFEIGGNSLLAVQLMFYVPETFQVELSPNQLLNSPTIAELANAIDQTRQTGAVAPATVIDLNAEAVLDSTIQPSSVPVSAIAKPHSILLTGATGFLGVHLLYDLLVQTTADIYCLVRAKNADDGKKRLQSKLQSYSIWDETFNSRIIPIVGELSQPLLGLSEQQFSDLAHQIEVIYHSGALVNFAYPYHALKAANVLGTQEILRLAAHTNVKPVHYVSTVSVFDAYGYFDGRIIRETDDLELTDGFFFGYAQSKWVAEKLVMIARERGIPVGIYRPGTIIGNSQTGAWNPDDFVFKMMKGCIQLGKWPNLNTTLHLTPVDYVSQAIVHLSQRPDSLGKAFHLVTPHNQQGSQLFDWINSFGYPIQQTTYPEWQTELVNIVKHSQENALSSLASLFIEKVIGEEQLTMPEMHVQGKVPDYDCQNTLNGLIGTSIVCPQIDKKLLSHYFSYFIQSGLLEPPLVQT